MNLLEPWIVVRLVAGVVAAWLFLRAAWVQARLLRFGSLASATEGQLALEQRGELARTSIRVGSGVQLIACLLTLVSADRLTATLRGAMCGYGVVHANDAGPWSVLLTAVTAVVAGWQLELLRLDRNFRTRALTRPLALGALVLAALSAADLILAASWLGGLDLAVVASCCSTSVDAADATGAALYGSGSARGLVTVGALASIPPALVLAWFASKQPRRSLVLAAGGLTALALPFALGALVLEVAPHVYEIPQHRCAYCLFKKDAFWIGYPLVGALFLAVRWNLGALLGFWAATTSDQSDRATVAVPFLRTRFRWGAFAWAAVLLLGAAPVIRFWILSGGRSLFAEAIMLERTSPTLRSVVKRVSTLRPGTPVLSLYSNACSSPAAGHRKTP